jgi:hypothetical protein
LTLKERIEIPNANCSIAGDRNTAVFPIESGDALGGLQGLNSNGKIELECPTKCPKNRSAFTSQTDKTTPFLTIAILPSEETPIHSIMISRRSTTFTASGKPGNCYIAEVGYIALVAW